jgi:mono/diheme cytochrome c family protein
MRRHRLLTLALLLPWTILVPAAENTAVFADNCVACHGTDGSANTPQGRKVKARDLRSSTLTDAEIERQIREGSKKKSGPSVMPAFGRDLTDAQIQEAIRTVKSFREGSK